MQYFLENISHILFLIGGILFVIGAHTSSWKCISFGVAYLLAGVSAYDPPFTEGATVVTYFPFMAIFVICYVIVLMTFSKLKGVGK